MYIAVKTFDEACFLKGLDSANVLPDVSGFPEEHQEALIALAKLIIIVSAVNGEWKPDWNKSDTLKWYPWFDMETDKNNPTGFRFDDALCFYSRSDVGSRLCFESREAAEYVGKQFTDLYKVYFTIQK